MKHPRIISLPTGPARDLRLARMMHARRQPERGPGRAWINGREVGGTHPRFAHLSMTHD